MKKFGYQLQINYKRIVFRNFRFFFFDLSLPIAFYLLFTKLVVQGIPTNELATWNQTYLISMIVYSTVLSSVITVANTLLDDHNRHFDTLLQVTPLSIKSYYAGLLIVFSSLTILSVVALCIVAFLVNQVSLSLLSLVLLLIIIPIGATPTIFIGFLVARAGSSNVVNLLTNFITFPMSILSGLWWPMSSFPNWLQSIGKQLPPYQLTKLANDLLKQQPLDWAATIGLITWSLVLIGLLYATINYQQKKGLQTA